MNNYEFTNNVKILYGENVLSSRLSKELKILGAERVLLLSGPVLNKLGVVDRVKQAIEIDGVKAQVVFIDIPNDSGLDIVENIAGVYRFNGCDSIVAVGGGSVMDTAKGVKLLISQRSHSMEQLLGMDMVLRGESIPFILIPTTSGTGSEVTNVSVITDKSTDTKLEFITDEVLPDVCILDASMTLTLPQKATLTTAFDALTHAIESYTGLQKNPLSDRFAVMSIQLFAETIEKVLDNPSDNQLRLKMALSSTLAGVSFSNSMVGAVHAIGHALGGECHIAHDVAMAILLPYVMEYNLSHSGELYGELLFYLDNDSYMNTEKNERGKKLIESIRKLYYRLADLVGAPKDLASLGVSDKSFDKIAYKALRDGAILTNAKSINEDDIKKILYNAYIINEERL